MVLFCDGGSLVAESCCAGSAVSCSAPVVIIVWSAR